MPSSPGSLSRSCRQARRSLRIGLAVTGDPGRIALAKELAALADLVAGFQVCYPRISAALSMAASSSALFKSTSVPNSAL
jgi:hypothetical protein